VGTLIGFFIVVKLSQASLPTIGSGNDGYWQKDLAGYVGVVLFGLIFLTASLVAIRNPRQAGLAFLVTGPVVAFCGAFASAGYLEWHADGGGYFESPFLSTALGLALLFFAPFLVALVTIRNSKSAAYLFLISATIVAPFFIRSRWTASFLPELAAWSAVFAAFGSFWRVTHKRGWPPLIRPRPQALSRRIAAILLTWIVILCVDVAMTLVFSALRSSLYSSDCGPKPPFTHCLSPTHTVFTARVILVGRSLQARTRVPGTLDGVTRPGPHDQRLGDWAIGLVQERFWGLPWWRPNLVLLTDYLYWKGETYFIDGRRADGLLARVLPIVSGGISCSRTRPVGEARVDLRVLKEGPSINGVRIIGDVHGPEPYVEYRHPPTTPSFVSGARIVVTSRTAATVATTDESGLYEIDGLPPDNYNLKLELPDTQDAPQQEVTTQSIARSSTVERNFEVVWNGSLEGMVRDNKGRPARVSLELEGPGVEQLPSFINSFAGTDANGSFRFKDIPQGRYGLLANSYGPTHESPYAPLYYPSALSKDEARIIDLAPGQHLRSLDFALERLVERRVPIRFDTVNGRPVKDPWFWAIYVRSRYYHDNPLGGGGILKTDENGGSEISVFGDDLRVWVFAEEFAGDTHQISAPLELHGSSLPDRLDLTVGLSESQFMALWKKITASSEQTGKP